MSDKPHEFNEDVDDYSMCVCGVPADVHAEAMSAHVLTTATIRERFADAYGNYENGLEDFDRWLAAHDAQVEKAAATAVTAIFTEARVVGRTVRADRPCGLDDPHDPHAYLYLQNHPERVTECQCDGRA